MSVLTDVEIKQEHKRQIVSTVITLIIYIAIFFIIAYLTNIAPKAKEEVIITKVKLSDKIREDNERLGNQNKTNIPKEIKKKRDEGIQKAKKGDDTPAKENSSNKKEIIEKSNDTKKAIEKEQGKDVAIAPTLNEKTALPEQKNDTKTTERATTFDTYSDTESEAKRELEKKFFADSNGGKKSGTKVDDLAGDDIDSLLKNIGTGGGGKADTNVEGSKKSNLDGDILWSGGRDRRLIAPLTIVPPREIAEAGVRPKSVKIAFVVYENGRVAEANIVVSTGNPNWDNAIVGEFKKNAIFEEASVKSSGVIDIELKYN